MRRLAGLEAALWLLFLIGSSASPVKPPTDTLSHNSDEDSTDFWHAFLNSDEDQLPVETANDAARSTDLSHIFDGGFEKLPWGELLGKLADSQPGQTANEAARFAPSFDQPPQLEGGATSSGHGQGPASLSYNNPSTAERSGGYQHASVQLHSAPRSSEPLRAGHPGYIYADQPTSMYRVRPDQRLVESLASDIPPGYGPQHGTSGSFQQPTDQHDYGYEQSPPTQQPTGHVSLTQPFDSSQHRQALQALFDHRTALGELLDQESGKDLVQLQSRRKPGRMPAEIKRGEVTVFHASPEAEAQVRALLQQKLDVLFPGGGAKVNAVDRTSDEVDVYARVRQLRNTLQLYRVSEPPYYRLPDGEPFVKGVEEGNELTSYFRAGRWVVMPVYLKAMPPKRWTSGHARIRVFAVLHDHKAEVEPTGEVGRRAKREPTALYFGDYEVPEIAASMIRTKKAGTKEPGIKKPTTGLAISEAPSGPPLGQARPKRGRPRKNMSGQ